MQYAADFLVAPDDRVELSAPRGLNQVRGIFLQCLVSLLAVLRGHFLTFAQFVDGGGQFLFVDARVFQNLAGRAVHREQGQDDRFKRHEFITVLGGIILCPCQHFVAFAAQVRFSALHFRERCDLAFQDLFDLSAVDTQLLEQEVRDIFSHFEDSGQQVLRFDSLLPSRLHEVDGFLDGFLGLDGKFVKCHGCSPLFIMVYSPNSLCGFKADIQEASKNLPFRAD